MNVAEMGFIEPVDVSGDGVFGLLAGLPGDGQISSDLIVLKKNVSTIQLSSQFPPPAHRVKMPRLQNSA